MIKNDLYDRINVRYIDTDYETDPKFANFDDYVVVINSKGIIKKLQKMGFKIWQILINGVWDSDAVLKLGTSEISIGSELVKQESHEITFESKAESNYTFYAYQIEVPSNYKKLDIEAYYTLTGNRGGGVVGIATTPINAPIKSTNGLADLYALMTDKHDLTTSNASYSIDLTPYADQDTIQVVLCAYGGVYTTKGYNGHGKLHLTKLVLS